jgi:hypothetical protein
MFEERPLTWSHLIDAEKKFSASFIGDWNWQDEIPANDETSCIIVHRPPVVPRARAIRNWLHDTYIGECSVTGFYWDAGTIPLAVRYRFPTFDDKLLFTLRWF